MSMEEGRGVGMESRNYCASERVFLFVVALIARSFESMEKRNLPPMKEAALRW